VERSTRMMAVHTTAWSGRVAAGMLVAIICSAAGDLRLGGGTRRYSGDDLTRLARIVTLAGQGVHLAGIARILDLEDANTELRDTNTALTAERDRRRRSVE
jgi:hypothetical protein